jgi:hypothetical protein
VVAGRRFASGYNVNLCMLRCPEPLHSSWRTTTVCGFAGQHIRVAVVHCPLSITHHSQPPVGLLEVPAQTCIDLLSVLLSSTYHEGVPWAAWLKRYLDNSDIVLDLHVIWGRMTRKWSLSPIADTPPNRTFRIRTEMVRYRSVGPCLVYRLICERLTR